MSKLLSDNRIVELVHSLPLSESSTATADDERGTVPRRSGHRQMGEHSEMRALEERVRHYEEELTRLRVENEQLRRSSQAFGELAERLNVALLTATRVNKKASGDLAGLLARASES
jgi:hypothetical protein